MTIVVLNQRCYGGLGCVCGGQGQKARGQKDDAPLGGGDVEHSHDNELNRIVAK